jgi:hypothetical protein
VRRRKLLARLASGALQNVAFRDLEDLAVGFRFRLVRQSGSHRIYSHPAVAELLNLQDVDGVAKPYQIRQLLRLVERYDLRLEDE